MLRRSFWQSSLATGFAVVLLIGANVRAADAPNDVKAAQGTWTLSAGEVDGKALTEKQLKGGKLEIKGDEYTVTMADEETLTGIEKLDPTKTPKAIDITDSNGPNKGKTSLGIYEIKGDEFRVVFAAIGKPRPTRFATTAGTGQWMHVWKKAK
jgi:uncharacterized protein (TIGR03067 family)